MSLHSSLKTDTAGSQQRSVLSRIERIKDLMKKGLWTEGQESTGLPKTKMLRVKAKKTKAKAEDETGAAAPAGGAKAAAGAKPADGAKKADAAKKPDAGKK